MLCAFRLLLNFIPVMTAILGHKEASQNCTPTPLQPVRVRILPTRSTENILESVTTVNPTLEQDLHPGIQRDFCQTACPSIQHPYLVEYHSLLEKIKADCLLQVHTLRKLRDTKMEQ